MTVYIFTVRFEKFIYMRNTTLIKLWYKDSAATYHIVDEKFK